MGTCCKKINHVDEKNDQQEEEMVYDPIKINGWFTDQMQLYSHSKEKIIFINEANHKKMQKTYHIEQNQYIKLIKSGNLSKLKDYIEDPVNEVEGYDLVYHAVRAGNSQIVEYLLQLSVSKKIYDEDSSLINSAAYFGHEHIITILKQYGIPFNNVDSYKSQTIQLAPNLSIQKQLLNLQYDQIDKIHYFLIKDLNYKYKMLQIAYSDKIVIKKLLLKKYFNEKYQSYKNAFQGTNKQNLKLIAREGFKKSAVFASPSIFYSTHQSSAEYFQTGKNNTEWVVLMQLKVKRKSYTQQKSTVKFYSLKKNEPEKVEWTISDNSDVVAVAIIFIKSTFLKGMRQHNKLLELVLQSSQQKKLKDQYQNIIFVRQKTDYFKEIWK